MKNLLRAVDVALDDSRNGLDRKRNRIREEVGMDEHDLLRERTDEVFDDIDNGIEVIIYTISEYAEHPDEHVREFVRDLKAEMEGLARLVRGRRKDVEVKDLDEEFDRIDRELARIKSLLKAVK